MNQFSFNIVAKDKNSRARAGVIKTQRGEIETPHFVTVATGAAVRGLSSEDLKLLDMKCAIVNTYHLHFNPGDREMKRKGGAYKVMKFSKPLFSDSGGFQIFSLAHNMKGINKLGKVEGEIRRDDKLVKIKDDGVEFISVYTGKKSFIGPKESMKIQSNLRTDIIMVFDECPSPLDDYEYNKKSLDRTHKWALESLKFHDKKQALYGIVQGGQYRNLREKSADFINKQNFDGIAIGGIFGEEGSSMHNVLDWIVPRLDDRPRHLLGIGEIKDIFECVERGIDTFDCVIPTRNARHGQLLVSPKSGGNIRNKFRINIENAQYRDDRKIIEKECKCYTCKNRVSRKKLRELYKKKDSEYLRFSTLHNLHFMFNLMKQIRDAIKKGKFGELKRAWLK